MSDGAGVSVTKVGGDPVELARVLVTTFKALADENRLAIALALSQHERSVTELTEIVGLSQTLVSHHLKALRKCGLVTVVAVGRSNVYSLCCEAVAEPIRLLAAVVATNTPT